MSDERERSRKEYPFHPLPPDAGPTTRLVHAGRRPDYNAGSVSYPIYATSNFRYPPAFSETKGRGHAYLYTRVSNPTVEAAAEPIRVLEGGESVRMFASGMGAITTAILSLVKSGETIVAPQNLYGGTLDLLTTTAPRLGIQVKFLTDAEAREPERHIPKGTTLLWLETPTNPVLHVFDLRRWSEAAHGAGALLSVDNTFATPINQRPLALGADLVMHSATKYFGGHSDLIAGVLVGPTSVLERIDVSSEFGAHMEPFTAFLIGRSLRTLALRMERHNRNAEVVARALKDHPRVERVFYPGWWSEEEEGVARQQMSGRGGMVSVAIRGGLPAARSFLGGLELFEVAGSLGGVESLVCLPVETSHRHLSESELAARGIPQGLARLSIGIEDAPDLIRDLTRALDAIP